MEEGQERAGRAGRLPAVTAGCYFAFSTAWIWFSGEAARALFGSVEAVVLFEKAKGFAFVAITSLALFAWLRWYARADAERRRELRRLNRDLERRIEERTAELVTANSALESFTYSVAHDLRAPVAHVDGFAKALAETLTCGNPECERARHYTRRIVANAQQMSEMIEGMLLLSRAERTAVEHEPVDMQALVQQVVTDLAPASPALVRIDPLPGARADPRLLRQVWCNLVANAIKYSAPSPAPLVLVSAHAAANEVVYCVQDNGIGFDAAEGARLFTVFQRLSNASAFPGSGVGLAIVKRIVERHGGRVWATGVPGGGARFCFALPL